MSGLGLEGTGLLLFGKIFNVYKKPDTHDKEDGSLVKGKFKVQVMLQKTYEHGHSEAAFENLSIADEDVYIYRELIGRTIGVQVSVWATGAQQKGLYIPKGAKPLDPADLLESFSAEA